MQYDHAHLFGVSGPHAKSLHLAILSDAADVVHLLKDSLGSAAHARTSGTECEQTKGTFLQVQH